MSSTIATMRGDAPTRHERAADVRAALCAQQACLSLRPVPSREEALHGEPPTRPERPRQACGRHVTTLSAALAVTRHEREHVDAGCGDDFGDELGQRRGEVATASLLPGGDEGPRSSVVDDRAARPCKRQPPARAFDAAPDGPGARAPAALAHRWPDADEGVEARLAERPARNGAARTAARQHETEQVHASTLRPSL